MNYRSIIASLAAGIILTACSASGSSSAGGPALTPGRAASFSKASKVSQYLFVGNNPNHATGSVTVYDASKNNLVETLTDGVFEPLAVAIGTDGYLYVANEDNGGTIGVYNSNWGLMRSPRSAEIPYKLAFDSLNNLYVEAGSFVVGLPNARLPKYKIRPRGGIAVDTSNNLYVASIKAINVYKTGQKSPFKSIALSTRREDAQLSTDANGNLYAALYGEPSACGQVSVYSVVSDALEYTLGPSDGVCEPEQVAVGPDGNVYVLNYNSSKSNVTVYSLGTTSKVRTISQGLATSNAMTFDETGNLYVSNRSNVTVYSPGSSSVLRTITTGIDSSDSLAFGGLK